jgi:hypothetical protein
VLRKVYTSSQYMGTPHMTSLYIRVRDSGWGAPMQKVVGLPSRFSVVSVMIDIPMEIVSAKYGNIVEK